MWYIIKYCVNNQDPDYDFEPQITMRMKHV